MKVEITPTTSYRIDPTASRSLEQSCCIADICGVLWNKKFRKTSEQIIGNQINVSMDYFTKRKKKYPGKSRIYTTRFIVGLDQHTEDSQIRWHLIWKATGNLNSLKHFKLQSLHRTLSFLAKRISRITRVQMAWIVSLAHVHQINQPLQPYWQVLVLQFHQGTYQRLSSQISVFMKYDIVKVL